MIVDNRHIFIAQDPSVDVKDLKIWKGILASICRPTNSNFCIHESGSVHCSLILCHLTASAYQTKIVNTQSSCKENSCQTCLDWRHSCM